MMSPRQVARSAWDLLLVISFAGILVAAYFAFFKPKPVAAKAADPRAAAAAMDLASQGIERNADKAEQAMLERVWDSTPEALGSQVLDLLTKIANEKHLQITDVRSERIINAPGLREAPYVVQLEGTFPDMIAAVAALEQADSKIAVSQLKMASNNAGRVTATLGITGFLKAEGA